MIDIANHPAFAEVEILRAVIITVSVRVRQNAAVDTVLVAEHLGEGERALQCESMEAKDLGAQLEPVVIAVVDWQIGGRAGQRWIRTPRLDIARARAREI